MYKNCLKFLLFFCFTSISYVSYGQSAFTSKLIGVGVVVADIERSVDFYVNGIGLVKTGGFNIAEDFSKRSGLANGMPFAVTVLKLENSPEANEWKLISFGKKSNSAKKSTYIQDDVGMQYITINVKALKPVMERLKKQNIAFLGNSPTTLNEKSQLLLVQDPDGNFVELIGPLE
jgi:hypothetical protein